MKVPFKRLIERELKRVSMRRLCEASGGHYWQSDGTKMMPDSVEYPHERCPCGALRLLDSIEKGEA